MRLFRDGRTKEGCLIDAADVTVRRRPKTSALGLLPQSVVGLPLNAHSETPTLCAVTRESAADNGSADPGKVVNSIPVKPVRIFRAYIASKQRYMTIARC